MRRSLLTARKGTLDRRQITEAALTLLDDFGLGELSTSATPASPRDTAGITRLLRAYVLASAEEPARPDPEAAEAFQSRLDEFPAVKALGPAFATTTADDLFALGTEVILDGLAHRRK